MGKHRSAFKMLTGKPTGMIPRGRPKCRSQDNIKMDFKEIRLGTQITE
jgi:hypothetical protein